MSPTPEQHEAAVTRLTAVLGGPRNGCGDPQWPALRHPPEYYLPRPVITPHPQSLCRGDN